MDTNQNDMMPFDLPKNRSSVIKVIGVGGGGSNAVNHMYGSGIKGVDFIVCNTDSQALENSPVPNKIQLGVSLTEGLGAGANPEIGEQAALESLEDVSKVLESNTKMVFITAGMGGGTGTGAAPVIAKAAKDMGILTVGIVTSPFVFEGKNRLEQANKGIESLRATVDSLVVINNNKLREVYGNLGFKAGFAKADEVLATAARGIAEVITHHYTANIDLRDAKTVLSNSGTAIMGAAKAKGEDRARIAITSALDSPLLNDNHIRGAKNVLLLIVSGSDEITIDEIGEVNDFIQNEAGGAANIIMGIGEDESLGEDIAITIIATGFNADQQSQVIGKRPNKVVHTLEDDQPISSSLYEKPMQLEEEEEDDILDQVIEEGIAEQESKQKEAQISIFEMQEKEQQFERSLESERKEPASTPKEEQEERKPEEETIRFNLEDLEGEAPLPEPQNQAGKEPEESEEISFSIFGLDEEEPANVETEDRFNYQGADKPKGTPNKAKEQSKPQAELDQNERIVHSLSDLEALEQSFKNAEPVNQHKPKDIKAAGKEQEPEDEELHFELKTKQKEDRSTSEHARPLGNPMEGRIDETFRLKSDERKAQLKAFNYRFKSAQALFNESEKEPAYKRQGINLEEGNISERQLSSRLSLNDDPEQLLKSNNSFLHDNVD